LNYSEKFIDALAQLIFARELQQVERIVRENQQQLLGAWNEYFGVSG
jgi:hypothetical protein